MLLKSRSEIAAPAEYPLRSVMDANVRVPLSARSFLPASNGHQPVLRSPKAFPPCRELHSSAGIAGAVDGGGGYHRAHPCVEGDESGAAACSTPELVEDHCCAQPSGLAPHLQSKNSIRVKGLVSMPTKGSGSKAGAVMRVLRRSACCAVCPSTSDPCLEL